MSWCSGTSALFVTGFEPVFCSTAWTVRFVHVSGRDTLMRRSTGSARALPESEYVVFGFSTVTLSTRHGPSVNSRPVSSASNPSSAKRNTTWVLSGPRRAPIGRVYGYTFPDRVPGVPATVPDVDAACRVTGGSQLAGSSTV